MAAPAEPSVSLELHALDALATALLRRTAPSLISSDYAAMSAIIMLDGATPSSAASVLGVPLTTASDRATPCGSASSVAVCWSGSTRAATESSAPSGWARRRSGSRAPQTESGPRIDGADGGIVAGDLWIPNLQDATLSRIDPQGNAVIETIEVGPGPFVVPNHPTELWVGSWAGTEVWRLRPR